MAVFDTDDSMIASDSTTGGSNTMGFIDPRKLTPIVPITGGGTQYLSGYTSLLDPSPFGLNPLWQTGAPGTPGGGPAFSLNLQSRAYDPYAFNGANYAGGDPKTGVNGDTGAYRGIAGSDTTNQIESSVNANNPINQYHQVVSDVAAGNLEGGLTIDYDTTLYYSQNEPAGDSNFGAGLGDLAAGAGWGAVAASGAVLAAGALAEGGPLGVPTAITLMGGAFDASSKAYNDLTNPDAEGALGDIFSGLFLDMSKGQNDIDGGLDGIGNGKPNVAALNFGKSILADMQAHRFTPGWTPDAALVKEVANDRAHYLAVNH